MTRLGLKALESHSEKINSSKVELKIAPDILSELKKDNSTWKNFQSFPEHYKKIRIDYIERVRERSPEQFEKRLKNFIKLTSQNKKFGQVKIYK
jgi:hypothetical protein